jgi:phosphopantothenoylcysteine decarboxylase / phosphopantothenate---cysteine ligase
VIHKRRGSRRLHIVVTAGPTREYFDTVRYISNASSGKMGYSIAEAARDAGHRVTLISGPVSLRPPQGVRTIQVISAEQMAKATAREFRRADAAVFAAAVSDFRPAVTTRHKRPKARKPRMVKLEPTPDIAAEMGRNKGNRVTIGFALEEGSGRRKALAKLRHKKFDAIILNGLSNIGADRAGAEVFVAGRWKSWAVESKVAIARRIVRLMELLS